LVNAGDLLVKLDSSSMEQEQVQQQITVNTSLSLVVQARNTYEAAVIARKEYLEGTFKQEEKVILGEVFVAEQGLRTAQLAYESSLRLAAKGYLAPLQLEGAQFAVDNSHNQLDAAENKLEVLRKYTKEKMLKQFDSDIATAEAKVRAEENSYQLEQDKLKEVEDQIEKCTIRAPERGQVVYANRYSSGRSSAAEFVVEAGSTVREQQPIIRLPDSSKMQVKALVNEARVTLVRPGLPVSIRIDALKDEVIKGEVIKVNQYAEPGGWSSGNIKKYATIVRILDPPPLLRSGMNAEVRIHVERRPDALQVPVQALAEHKGHFFCVVKKGDKYETREVQIGSTNDKVAVIDNGLADGEQVVMNPRGQGGRLLLPDLPDSVPMQIAEIKRSAGAPITAIGMSSNGAGPAGAAAGKRGKGPPSAGAMVDRALESDADKDGKLSKEEITQMDERRRQMVATADSTSDGFVDRSELTIAAAGAVKRMQEMRKAAGGAEGGAGGPGGGPVTGGGQ
jgi:RND family efflux transporter MFP subunit